MKDSNERMIELEREEICRVLQQYPFWEKLSEKEKGLLEGQVRRNVYREGQMVSSTGSDCLGLFLIRKGTLRVYLVSEDGKEATVFRLHEGEICVLSGSCLLSSLPFDVQIDSETDSEIYLLPTGSFRQIMEENIYVENFIYKMMTESFSDIIAAVQQMLFGSLKQRLISFLLDESSRCGSLEIHMTQEQIARSIGSAREAVSRVLKQLAGEGGIQLFRGGVRLTDKKRLYQMV